MEQLRPPQGNDMTFEVMQARLDELAAKLQRKQELDQEIYHSKLEKYKIEISLGGHSKLPIPPFVARTTPEVTELVEKRTKQDRASVLELAKNLTETVMRRKRYVDGDMSYGFNVHETSIVQTLHDISYVMVSSVQSHRYPVNQQISSTGKTSLYAFAPDLAQPLEAKIGLFHDELPDFPLWESQTSHWGLVLNDIEQIAEPRAYSAHRQDWEYVNQHEFE